MEYYKKGELLHTAQIAKVRKAFIEADVDGSGNLDLEELGQILRRFKKDYSTEQLQRKLEANDRDRNGRLDFDEFVALLGWSKQGSAPPLSPSGSVVSLVDDDLIYVGARCSFARGSESSPCTVLYVGTTLFGPGDWYGIELEQAGFGKIDGSVRGHRYFTCRPGMGAFCRRSALVLLENGQPPIVAAPDTAQSDTAHHTTSNDACHHTTLEALAQQKEEEAAQLRLQLLTAQSQSKDQLEIEAKDLAAALSAASQDKQYLSSQWQTAAAVTAKARQDLHVQDAEVERLRGLLEAAETRQDELTTFLSDAALRESRISGDLSRRCQDVERLEELVEDKTKSVRDLKVKLNPELHELITKDFQRMCEGKKFVGFDEFLVWGPQAMQMNFDQSEYRRATLMIDVKEAVNFRPTLKRHNVVQNAPNPYVIVSCGSVEVFTTRKKKRTVEPAWRETSEAFVADLSSQDQSSGVLTFKVMSSHNLHADDVLGSADVRLAVLQKAVDAGSPLDLVLVVCNDAAAEVCDLSVSILPCLTQSEKNAREDFRKLKHAFERLDKDGSGTIDMQEYIDYHLDSTSS